MPGVKLQVLGFDSQFQLTNRSSQTVTVFGYDGEPYARILPNGTVEQNHLSPATYINVLGLRDRRAAQVHEPEGAAAVARRSTRPAPSSGTTTACTGWARNLPPAGEGQAQEDEGLRLPDPPQRRRAERGRSAARCTGWAARRGFPVAAIASLIAVALLGVGGRDPDPAQAAGRRTPARAERRAGEGGLVRRRALTGRGRPVTAALCCAALGGARSCGAGGNPARPATPRVHTQPAVVSFRFNESVEGNFGAVRVFDSPRGTGSTPGTPSIPNGTGSLMGVHLKPHLPAGTYTATYRVVSADGHIVSSGFNFSIGHPRREPAKPVSSLIGGSEGGGRAPSWSSASRAGCSTPRSRWGLGADAGSSSSCGFRRFRSSAAAARSGATASQRLPCAPAQARCDRRQHRGA